MLISVGDDEIALAVLQQRCVGCQCHEQTAILLPQKVVRCLMPPPFITPIFAVISHIFTTPPDCLILTSFRCSVT